jgi:hypothetical protein
MKSSAGWKKKNIGEGYATGTTPSRGMYAGDARPCLATPLKLYNSLSENIKLGGGQDSDSETIASNLFDGQYHRLHHYFESRPRDNWVCPYSEWRGLA